MINYLKKKLERRKIKNTFAIYDSKITTVNLSEEGKVRYAQWMNPLGMRAEITQSQVNFYKKFVNKGEFAIDIGAHTGDTTIPLALAVGPDGLVLALDPNPIVFKVLKENAALNPEKTSIIAMCAAATIEEDDFFFSSSEATFSNGGIAKTAKNRHGRFTLKEKVKGINLNNYLRKELTDRLDSLSLIKIDTEGHDRDIIASLTDIIGQYRPVLIAECFKYLKKDEKYSLYDLVSGMDYCLYYIKEFEEKTEISSLSKSDVPKLRHFDFCAIPNERKDAFNQRCGGQIN